MRIRAYRLQADIKATISEYTALNHRVKAASADLKLVRGRLNLISRKP